MIGTPGTRDAEPAFNLAVLQAHGAAFTLYGTPTAADLSDAAERLRAGGAAGRARLLGDLLRGTVARPRRSANWNRSCRRKL